MLPESIPVLKGKDAKKFEERIAESPSQEAVELFKKAEEVYNKIKHV